jgi:hypothetical protein
MFLANPSAKLQRYRVTEYHYLNVIIGHSYVWAGLGLPLRRLINLLCDRGLGSYCFNEMFIVVP